MKRILFALLLFPLAGYTQTTDVMEGSNNKKWEGMKIKDCQEFVLNELADPNGEFYNELGKGRITNKTRTIYIAEQAYLKEAPDSTANGINIEYIKVDSNSKWLCTEIDKKDAAVYYMSNLHMDAAISEIYIFPISVKSGLFKKPETVYEEKSLRVKFQYKYDPPRFHYMGYEVVDLGE